MSEKGVPFTILTGFLGAGKTTVLNRILSAPGGKKIAVLVNELGRIAIDSKLILSRGGDVLELAGGCVCCKVDTKNDLWDGIADVIERSSPDYVILETTGIAEPGAILDGFRYLPESQQDCVSPAGIVSVVEAEAGPRILGERIEAREQIMCADRLLLSKLDLATPEQARLLHTALDSLNPDAERASFPAGETASRALTSWVLLKKGKLRPARPHSHSHSQGQLNTISFEEDAPLLGERLLQLLKRHQGSLYRAKGFVHIAGESQRGFLELAGDRVSLSYRGKWPDSRRFTELVLIGENLDEASLRRQLWACRAG
ncbi:MAG: GTP-binding protein [Kofleriaceae bacterium]|nr:GTP-binding protein [Kofleriaceae bacterium]